jgi:UDP-3-O-[3-hydroxymyristoyl] glucosamine N-acyltransferase
VGRNEIRLSDLAERIGARLVGNGESLVSGVGPIESAGPGQVTFLSNPRYARHLSGTRATAVIAAEAVEGAPCAFLVAGNPYQAFARALEIFHPPYRPPAGVSPQAFVHPEASLGTGVTISPFAVVGEGASVGDRTVIHAGVVIGRNVAVGSDCLIYPRVVLYDGVRVGDRVILHAGCVVGADGFGFAPTPAGYRKVPQVGTVEIEDDVEIGANTAVEAGISGSTRIGNRVMIGGQVGLAGHIEVGDGVMLGAKAGVADSLRAEECRAWSGVPAMPHKTWLKSSVLIPRLPELFKRVRKLEGGKKEEGGEES